MKFKGFQLPFVFRLFGFIGSLEVLKTFIWQMWSRLQNKQTNKQKKSNVSLMKFDKMKINTLTGHNVWTMIHKNKQTLKFLLFSNADVNFKHKLR